MAASTNFINALLDAGFRGQTYTGGTITLALYTGNLPSNGGTEVTGGGYARKTLTFSAAANKVITTVSSVTFSDLPTSAVIVAYAVFSDVTQIDEKLLDNPFQADVQTNELRVNYSFSIGA